jgi:cytochrome c553
MQFHTLLAIMALGLAGGVCAQDNTRLGRSYAASCAACHGTEGVSAGGAVPGLAGMNANYLSAQMKAFKEGTRPATVMHQIAKGYSDEQVALIAQYFAAQPAQYKNYPKN